MKTSGYKVSRRDFLKLMGSAGFSFALRKDSAALINDSNPVLRFADNAGRPRRPWWVKNVDQPTIEVDWKSMQRFNACNSISAGRGDLAKYIGAAEEAVLIENESRQKIENIENHVPGFSLRDYVLNDVFKSDTSINGDLLGPSIPSPIDRGVPIWEGSPEEAARIIRIAMRMFGAAQVGFVELNENTKKLIFSTDPDGKVIDFEDTELAYETADKRVIPNKARWVIAYTVRLSVENMKHAPSLICNLATRSGYSRARYIQNHTQAFIKGLGYQCIGQVVQNGLGISPAFSVLAGHGEMSRLNRMITPEYGPMVQTFLLITDLPVATDQPINAGILEFCRTCKKCSESCPSAALNTEDEPSWEVQGDWNNQGHRAFFENGVRCNAYWKEVGSSCSICFSVCPFSKKNSAWVHSLVKASISTTPLLNSFFRSMDDALSYGAQKGLEEWWLLDFPEYGLAPKDWKG